MRRTVVAGDIPTALPEGVIIRETAKAVFYEHEGKQVWVPKAVIHGDSEISGHGDRGVLLVKQWWAGKNGYA